MSTKVLQFSRHEMTPDQRAALGDSEITQIDKTIKHASELADEISQCDVLAVVAPVELQREFLEQAGDKPVITAVNDRILVPTENGESKVQFSFVKWEQVKKIDIVKEDFDIGKYEKDRELQNLKGFTLTKDNLADCVDAATGQPIPTEGDVILPEKVIYNGKEQKLTNIGDAFYNCNLLKSVKIPEGVRKIGSEAFYGCDNLTSIDMPNSVVEIGQDAFLYTKWLNHDRPEDRVSYLRSTTSSQSRPRKTLKHSETKIIKGPSTRWCAATAWKTLKMSMRRPFRILWITQRKRKTAMPTDMI